MVNMGSLPLEAVIIGIAKTLISAIFLLIYQSMYIDVMTFTLMVTFLKVHLWSLRNYIANKIY